jgi:hypothetical protein
MIVDFLGYSCTVPDAATADSTLNKGVLFPGEVNFDVSFLAQVSPVMIVRLTFAC